MRSVGGEDQVPESSSPQSEEQAQTSNSEWALERECELARLEKENEVLKRMLGISGGLSGDGQREQGVVQIQRTNHSNSTGGHGRTLSNQSDEIGPFGAYGRRSGV